MLIKRTMAAFALLVWASHAGAQTVEDEGVIDLTPVLGTGAQSQERYRIRRTDTDSQLQEQLRVQRRTMEHEHHIPTATVTTARFADYVGQDTESHGMKLRWAFPPYPVGWVSKSVLRGYVDGDDPVTGKPLMREMVDALTQPLTEEEKNPTIVKRPKRPRLLEKDTEANLHRSLSGSFHS